MSEAPKIHAALVGVTESIAPVGKSGLNERQNYNFRSIDDLISALQPALVANNVHLAQRVVEHREEFATDRNGGSIRFATVLVDYTFFSADDGSSVVVTGYGDAADTADKAGNKAMSAAFKYAIGQTFAVRFGADDGDADHPSVTGVTATRQNIPPAPALGQRVAERREATQSTENRPQAGSGPVSAKQVDFINSLSEAIGLSQVELDHEIELATGRAGATVENIDKPEASAVINHLKVVQQDNRQFDDEPF